MTTGQESRFLILTGDGINCANETAWAFELAGGQADIVHINDLLETPARLLEFDGMAFPGGFSFGDDLGSGQVMALKMRHALGTELKDFVAKGSPIIGICNGFQMLTKLGLLPHPTRGRSVALAPNLHGQFIDRWVTLERPHNSVCKWTEGLTQFDLPIRHGEGRVVFSRGQEKELYQELEQNGQIALQYSEDVNGSHANIAAICDPTGLILGLMPHPEAHLFALHQPQQVEQPFAEGAGLKLFQNIITHLNRTSEVSS